jgi:hypothetical protein
MNVNRTGNRNPAEIPRKRRAANVYGRKLPGLPCCSPDRMMNAHLEQVHLLFRVPRSRPDCSFGFSDRSTFSAD